MEVLKNGYYNLKVIMPQNENLEYLIVVWKLFLMSLEKVLLDDDQL